MNKNFKILDCTIRDGGYINNWNFKISDVKSMCKALSLSGVDIFEIGFISDKTNLPKWRVCNKEDVKYVIGQQQTMKISAMLEADTLGIKINVPKETGIDILRVALNKNKVLESLKKIEQYKKAGYEIFVQLMGITSYKEEELVNIIRQIEICKSVDYISIGDSYGALTPNQTFKIISLIKKNVKLKVGLHAHNNMQLGMANALAAIQAGADVIDGSLYGMGRGGGNIPTELLISYFEKIYKNRFSVLPLLEFIDRTMLSWYEQPNWGYSLHSLISGVYECHPYYTSKLIEKREYTIEQVLETAKIVNKSDVIGFSQNFLDNIIDESFLQKTIVGKLPLTEFIEKNKGQVPYKNRHQGKTFLILGNGPSIVENFEKIQKFIKEKEPIILGANNLGGNFIPHYHAFNNQRRFEVYENNVNPYSRVLLGPGVSSFEDKANYEKIFCYNSFLEDVDIINGVITSNCRSISVLLIAVAIVMGAESIYLGGMDGYLNGALKCGSTMFYKEDESIKIEDLIEKHQSNEKFLNQLDYLLNEINGKNLKFITPSTYKLRSTYCNQINT